MMEINDELKECIWTYERSAKIVKYPVISVIIPCYNSENRLPECIDSIFMQDYPRDKIEIIIVDDDSTDKTVELAKKYNCKVVKNGTHNIERGKSIGVEHSTGEYIFLIDDDNRLPHSHWLRTLVETVIREKCVGGQASYFDYQKNDTLANRYAALYAVNDPTCIYLHKRDKLMQIEKKWTLPGEIIKKTKLYWKIKFNPDNLLTIGSQGFLIKKELLMKTSWSPYLYHMDVNMELVRQGYNTYIMLRDTVIHKHSDSVEHFVGKLKRNIRLFYSENEYRTYTYNISFGQMIRLGLTMGIPIVPLLESIRGYCIQPDIAWFLHPVICFRVAIIYAYSTIKNKLKLGDK